MPTLEKDPAYQLARYIGLSKSFMEDQIRSPYCLITGFVTNSVTSRRKDERTLTIYEQMMNDPQTNRWVLVTIGFGDHQPARIEKAFKAYVPQRYYEYRRKANALKVVPMTTEGMSKDRRNRMLDKEAAVMSLINKGDGNEKIRFILLL